MAVLETIKAHPFVTAGVVVAGVAVILIIRSGGDSGSVVMGPDPSATAAGTALQLSQQEQQTRMAGISAQLQSQASDNATRVELAKIEGQYSYDVANLSAGVKLSEIDKTSQLVGMQSTLLAQTEMARIKSATDITSIKSNEAIMTTQTIAGALVATSAQNAAVAMASINKEPQSFWDSIFG